MIARSRRRCCSRSSTTSGTRCGGRPGGWTPPSSTRLEPSTLTLGGLLKHLAFVEGFWFRYVLLGEDHAEPWASVDWRADPDWDHHSAADDSPEELCALLDAAVARSRPPCRAGRRRGRRPGGPGGTEPVPACGGSVHMVEEYARHCGHADLIRESIDGAVDL